ncbi:MAG: lysozyme [Alphaproteobacteria bacterium]|nr:lysozyme [Alphaproteobacteria bacterium]
MKYSDDARHNLTESFEGCRLTAYPDPGTGSDPWTIGYGHTGCDVFPGLTWTQEEADQALSVDIGKFEDAVNNAVSVQLTQHQFDACVDFTFNVGAHAFENSTLCRLLNQGDFAGADAEFGRWVNGGGHRLPGLVKRRAAEANWFVMPDVSWGG